MMNTERARTNMISQQIRTCDVLDDNLLAVIASTPREFFVPETYRDLAFADTNIPLEHGQTMMSPMQEAKMLQALSIGSSDNVLEIGTGTGYVTALLAKQAKQVSSIDIFEDFTALAKTKLHQLDLSNITLVTGDGAQGYGEPESFDAIAVTGSTPLLPDAFKQSLRVGGRLFVVVGTAPGMQALLITRDAADTWRTKVLFETHLLALEHAKQSDAFIF